MRLTAHAIVFALLAACYPSASQAEIVRLRLTGKVSIQGNILPADLVAGADPNVLVRPDFDAPGGKRFVAYWSYDTSIPDASPELPVFGVYPHPLADPLTAEYGLSVQIDDYVFRLDTMAEPYTVGVSVGRLSDSCTYGCGDFVGTSQANVLVPFEFNTPQTINARIGLSLADSLISTVADSSLSSDELPTTLDITEFDLGRIQIAGIGEVGVGSTPSLFPPSFFIQAWINQITVVPEPSALCLFSLSASIFIWRFRR